jgi:GNAT superfamily N-acetyltransferase
MNESQYSILLAPLRQVSFNTLFIRSVIAGHVQGKIFADSAREPKSFYAIHGYGMSLLFGDADNKNFNNELFDYFAQATEPREMDEWLQAFPRAWDIKLLELEKRNKAIRYNRLNFSFDKHEYDKNNSAISLDNHSIVPTSPDMYSIIEGAVSPKAFWRDEQIFSKMCISYTVIIDGNPASTAFTAYLHDGKLEIGIETLEKYRGKGLARIACMALINYCIENDLEPVWSCRLENAASVNLAKKLGFRETMRLPYYHIPV